MKLFRPTRLNICLLVAAVAIAAVPALMMMSTPAYACSATPGGMPSIGDLGDFLRGLFGR